MLKLGLTKGDEGQKESAYGLQFSFASTQPSSSIFSCGAKTLAGICCEALHELGNTRCLALKQAVIIFSFG